MTWFGGLCVWLVSLLIATFLGYDRGRWAAGLLLGLVFGPLGIIAAGLMQPSVEYEGQRRYIIECQVAECRRRDELALRKKRKARAELDALAHSVEERLDHADVGFADGLQELAGDLKHIGDSEPPPDGKLRSWVTWLNDKAEMVRTFPRHEREEL